MERNLVVIPYIGESQGCEIELAVAGWRQHFKDPYLIVIIGEADEHVKNIIGGDELTVQCEDVLFLPCSRVEPIDGQYMPHIDMVNKFNLLRNFFPQSEGFIYTCDDIYATQDFTMEDILKPKHPEIGPYFEPYDWHGKHHGWWEDRGKTAELCVKEGLPVRDWVCHLPVYYDWNKLIDIYDKYDCYHNSYIVENIYFGKEFGDQPSIPAISLRDDVRTSNASELHIPIGSRMWVTNGTCGWSEKLENLLKEHYNMTSHEL